MQHILGRGLPLLPAALHCGRLVLVMPTLIAGLPPPSRGATCVSTTLDCSLRPVITNGLQESAVTKQLDQAALAQWKADVTPDDVCRLHTGAATGARTLWELPPRLTTTSPMRNSPLQ